MSKMMAIDSPSKCRYRVYRYYDYCTGWVCRHTDSDCVFLCNNTTEEFPENCPLKDAEKEGDE